MRFYVTVRFLPADAPANGDWRDASLVVEDAVSYADAELAAVLRYAGAQKVEIVSVDLLPDAVPEMAAA